MQISGARLINLPELKKEGDSTDDGCPQDPSSTDRSSQNLLEKKELWTYREDTAAERKLQRLKEKKGELSFFNVHGNRNLEPVYSSNIQDNSSRKMQIAASGEDDEGDGGDEDAGWEKKMKL